MLLGFSKNVCGRQISLADSINSPVGDDLAEMDLLSQHNNFTSEEEMKLSLHAYSTDSIKNVYDDISYSLYSFSFLLETTVVLIPGRRYLHEELAMLNVHAP